MRIWYINMSWVDMKWLTSREQKTLYEMWQHESMHLKCYLNYKNENVYAKRGRSMVRMIFAVVQYNNDRCCLVVEWAFMFWFGHLVVWQYMKFWSASREYDYKPWVDIVSWILVGFQILEVLWKMITYMYRFIYKHMKIPEGFQLPEACTLNSREQYSIRLKSFL